MTFDIVRTNEPQSVEEMFARAKTLRETFFPRVRRVPAKRDILSLATPRSADEPRAPRTLAEINQAIAVLKERRLSVFGEGSYRLLELLTMVSIASGFPLMELRSDRRPNKVAQARFTFSWIARRFTTHSTPQIGMALGGRDHTTVLHGSQRAQAVVDTIPPPSEDTPEAWIKVLLAADWRRA